MDEDAAVFETEITEHPESLVKRLAAFLRSVMPADPWQLLFLGGAILLFISPRLGWFPEAILESSGSRGFDWSVRPGYFIPFLLPTVLAGLVAYYTCFWAGKRPIRRILFGVFAPSVLTLGLLSAKFFQWSAGARSIFDTRSEFSIVVRWLSANIALMPTGMYVCLLALLMLGIFTVRVGRRASTLPLSMPPPVDCADESETSWYRLQLTIYFLVCLLFLFRNSTDALIQFPRTHWSGHSALASVYGVFANALRAALLVAPCVLIIGQSAWKDARISLRLSRPRYVILGLAIPIGVSLLISLVPFAMDRLEWTRSGLEGFSPTHFASYFHAERILRPVLLLTILPALSEEVVFRGLILRRLLSRYGVHRGIFLIGLIWAAFHFHSDPDSELSPSGVFVQLGVRIAICLAMNYVLAWLTLRCSSVIPAAIAHAASNMLIESHVNTAQLWTREWRIVFWAVAGLVLFRYWPVKEEEGPDVIANIETEAQALD